MSKLLSLLKVTFKEDFNRRGSASKGKKSTFTGGVKMLLALIVVIIILFGIGTYAYLLANELAPYNLTYIVIGLFSIVPVFVILLDGIWRAGEVLYTSRDNDMLLSMPIKKGTILLTRFVRFVAFEYMWTFLIMIPVIAVYEYFEPTNLEFYISTVLYTLTIPIIPTILACIVGYITKVISSRFRRKNIVLSFLFLLVFAGMFAGSFLLQNNLSNIVSTAQNINDMLSRIYYPLGIYLETLFDFNLIKLLLLILAEMVLIAVFIYIFSINYYKIISRLSEYVSRGNYKISNEKKKKVKSPLYALFRKELARYISSPIYLMNTAAGAIIVLFGMLYFIFNMPTELVIEGQDLSFLLSSFPIFIMLALTFIFGISTTTSSSISLEGKNLWIMKGLPVKTSKIFLAKMLINLLVLWPVGFIVIIAFTIKLKLAIVEVLFLFAGVLVMGLYTAISGLIINLIFPKLNFKSDQQVVKQSMSTFVATFSGMAPAAIIALIAFALKIQDYYTYGYVCIGIMAVVVLALWAVLNTYGAKKFRAL